MTISAQALRETFHGWAQRQHSTMESLDRALKLVYKDRPGARTAEELAFRVLVAAANRHDARVAGWLREVDEALARLMEDLDALRAGEPRGRDPRLRAADLKVLADSLDHFATFEDSVKFMTDGEAGELRTSLAEDVRAGVAAANAPGAPPAPPATPHVPAAPTLRGLLDREHTILADADAILAAYRRGETFEPYLEQPRRVRTGRDVDTRLARQMELLERARNEYRSASGDPVAAAAALERFRRLVSESGEVLRESAVRAFETSPAADPLPPSRRPVGPARPGSPGARLLDAEARIRALAAEVRRPASLGAARLFDALQFSETEARAKGTLGEPLRRSHTEGKLLSANEIRTLPTDPPWLADVLANHLEGYQRAHLVGPGFGAEEVHGVMLAPEGVNQTVQNRGIEKFLRKAASLQPGSTSVTMRAKGRRLLIPLTGGRFDHVDVVVSVHYQVHRPAPLPPLEFEVVVKPNGQWNVTRNDLPVGAPGAGVPTSGNR
ncbi:MAG TPA: polymorphic toxin type 4 domain-containing protein [Pseudonocardia sp.]|nr:polymorphic toxin type 4 domain-containing protein [Pseudonocardia sp.]